MLEEAGIRGVKKGWSDSGSATPPSDASISTPAPDSSSKTLPGCASKTQNAYEGGPSVSDTGPTSLVADESTTTPNGGLCEEVPGSGIVAAGSTDGPQRLNLSVPSMSGLLTPIADGSPWSVSSSVSSSLVVGGGGGGGTGGDRTIGDELAAAALAGPPRLHIPGRKRVRSKKPKAERVRDNQEKMERVWEKRTLQFPSLLHGFVPLRVVRDLVALSTRTLRPAPALQPESAATIPPPPLRLASSLSSAPPEPPSAEPTKDEASTCMPPPSLRAPPSALRAPPSALRAPPPSLRAPPPLSTPGVESSGVSTTVVPPPALNFSRKGSAGRSSGIPTHWCPNIIDPAVTGSSEAFVLVFRGMHSKGEQYLVRSIETDCITLEHIRSEMRPSLARQLSMPMRHVAESASESDLPMTPSTTVRRSVSSTNTRLLRITHEDVVNNRMQVWIPRPEPAKRSILRRSSMSVDMSITTDSDGSTTPVPSRESDAPHCSRVRFRAEAEIFEFTSESDSEAAPSPSGSSARAPLPMSPLGCMTPKTPS